MANLRAGLIGLGMMGRHHARVLSSLPGVDLVAVADAAGDPHKVAGSRPLLGSVEELIAVGIDYCLVAVPTAFHEPVGMALAEAGVHAMIEKPLAQNIEGAQRLADAFAAKGLVGAVGHIERYNPALQQARLRIARGDLGEIYQISTRRQGPFPGRISDVGVILDLATHDIDLTGWVAQQEFAQVSAQTAHRSGRPHEDLVAVTGQLADGTVTNHLVNWVSPLKERITTITGEFGAFVVDTISADLTLFKNGVIPTGPQLVRFRGVREGDVIRFAFPKPEPLRVEHEHFRDVLLGLEADLVTLEQGAATVAVASAIAKSARDGRTISLERQAVSP